MKNRVGLFSRSFKALAIVAAAVTLSGCAFGKTQSFTGVISFTPELPVTPNKLMIAVQDQRPAVVSGETSPSHVGVQRSIAGVPWSISTTSGRPLAQDLGEMIAQSLSTAGHATEHTVLGPAWSDKEVLNAISGNTKGASKILQFTLREWKDDIWFQETFTYCADLRVRSIAGADLGFTSQCGKEDLGSGVEFDNLQHAVGTVFGRMINSKEAKGALQK